MFDLPVLPGVRKSLGVYRLPDTLRVLDLDDPSELLKRALRPTQVVARNLAVTQRWGHDIWVEPDPHDATARRWEAVSRWSPHQPSWSILASWRRPTVESVEPLDLAHPAVADAAASLLRPLDR